MKANERPAAQALAKARMQACRDWPYASAAILSLSPVPTDQVDIAAVDANWRLYYRPAGVEACKPSEVAAIILHEVAHLLLRHHKRAGNVVPADNEQAWQQWNVATDIAVNWLLPERGKYLPEGVMTHDMFGFPSGLSAEQYYHLLTEKAEEQDESSDREHDDQSDAESGSGSGQSGDQSNGTGGEGEPEQPSLPDSDPGDGTQGEADNGPGESDSGDGPGQSETASASGEHKQQTVGGDRNTDGNSAGTGGDGEGSGHCRNDGSGSCSDGRQRPWELDPDDTADGEAPGLEEHEAEQIIRQAAERAEKDKGSGSGNSQAFIDEVLNPKVDPRRLLMRAVQCHTENIISGAGGRFTYRRPARRPGIGGTIRPRSFRSVPRILVLIDTSGSMSRTDLGLSVGLVGKVLSGLNLRDGVRVIAGDEGSQWAGKVFDPSKISLCGGGGTDMGAIISELDEPGDIDLIICATDGYTGWPGERTRASLVVCLTRTDCIDEVPSWADKIDMSFSQAR